MTVYRKKPVEIEAQPLPTEPDGAKVRAVAVWMVDHGFIPKTPETIDDVDAEFVHDGKLLPDFGRDYILIETLEGDMRAYLGDYIVRGVKGEFYPCKPDIFAETYEEVA